MKAIKSNRAHWSTVAVFAIAMAWVESAVVYYLRTLVHRIEPYQPDPLPVTGVLGEVELMRELATMIMLFTVGVLAGRTWRSRWGFAAVAFGVWDIFYYVFLKIMCGWPHSLLDWDVLFLIPLPWWGPVLAPMLIALLMIVWGTLASRFEQVSIPALSSLTAWGTAAIGMALALYLFMADALHVANQGVDVIRRVLPEQFNWPLFCGALTLMSAPIVSIARRVWKDRLKPEAATGFPTGSQSEQA